MCGWFACDHDSGKVFVLRWPQGTISGGVFGARSSAISMGGRGCDWVIGCGFLRARVVFLLLFTLFG